MQNTERCLEIVEGLISEYSEVIVATTTGGTGIKFAEKFAQRANVIAVTHSFSFHGKNKSDISPEAVEKIRQLKGKVFTGTTVSQSWEMAFPESQNSPSRIIANTLKIIGRGVKVCVEIVLEACDAGLIPEGKEVLAVGGSARGADTVCLVKSACSQRFLDLRVMEILAKPRQWPLKG